MKLKNINFVERHFEKFVILIALCVLGYALYNWGLSTPYKVKLNNQEVTAGRVDEVIDQATQRLETVISGEDIHDALDGLEIRRIEAETASELRRPLLRQPDDPDRPKNEIAQHIGSRSPGIGGTNPDPIDPYYEPVVPTPTLAAARPMLRTIHPDEFLNNPQLENEFVNATKPDTAEITVAGQFPMFEMLKQLTRQPDDGSLAIPEEWWLTRFEIAGFIMERRELRPDGTWSAPVVVDPIPGGALAESRKITDRIHPEDNAAALPIVLEWIAANRGAIIQQPFLETIGDPWIVPRKLTAEELARAGEAGKIKLKIKELQTQLNQRLQRIQKLQNFGKTDTNPGAPGTGAPGLPGSLPGELETPGTRPRPTRPTRPGNTGSAAATARQKQIAVWQKLAEKTQTQIAELEKEYEELTGEVIEREQPNRLNPVFPGGGFEGEFGPGAPGFDPRRGSTLDPRGRGFNPGGIPGGEFGQPRQRIDPRTGQPIGPGGLLDGEGGEGTDGVDPADPDARLKRLAIAMGGESIDIWQADLGVTPGKTYQYRFVIKVLNPLYAKPMLPGKLDDPKSQRAQNYDKYLISSKPSEWSEPVLVPEMTRAYVRAATPNPKPGQVTFRVHRFSWGEWRAEEFIVRPGDAIGGVKRIDDPNLPAVVDVNFETGMHCLDVDFDFKVKQGIVDRRVPRVLIVEGPNVTARRIDLDKEAENQWQTDRALDGEFAVNR